MISGLMCLPLMKTWDKDYGYNQKILNERAQELKEKIEKMQERSSDESETIKKSRTIGLFLFYCLSTDSYFIFYLFIFFRILFRFKFCFNINFLNQCFRHCQLCLMLDYETLRFRSTKIFSASLMVLIFSFLKLAVASITSWCSFLSTCTSFFEGIFCRFNLSRFQLGCGFSFLLSQIFPHFFFLSSRFFIFSNFHLKLFP